MCDSPLSHLITPERYVGVVVPGSSTTNCTCVSSSNCLAGDVITDGHNVGIDLRDKPRYCTYGQVCCEHPTDTTGDRQN